MEFENIQVCIVNREVTVAKEFSFFSFVFIYYNSLSDRIYIFKLTRGLAI